jgi:hypothetical protein
MGRGIGIGFVLGAVLAACLFYGVRAARGGTAHDAGARKQGGVTQDAADSAGAEEGRLKTELESLKVDRASLAKEVQELDGKLAAARVAKAGRDSEARKAKNPWAKLGKKLYQMRDQLDEMGEGSDPEGQKLMAEVLQIFMELGEKHKIPMNELEGSPWVMPMLMLAILEGSDLPPDAAQTEKMDGVIAAAEAAWAEYEAGRKEMSALESRRAQAGMLGGALGGLRGSMTPDQLAIFDKIKIFNRESPRGYTSQTNGSRTEIAENFTRQWAAQIGLDPSQSAVLTPFVTEYIAAVEALQSEWRAKEAAGQKVDGYTKSMAQLDLMIAAQKKIGDSVTLDDKQKKKLNAWSEVYGFEIR